MAVERFFQEKSLKELKAKVRQAFREAEDKDIIIKVDLDPWMGKRPGRPINSITKQAFVDLILKAKLKEINENFESIDLTKAGTIEVSLADLASALSVDTKGLSNAVGRYFEYQVYANLQTYPDITTKVGEGYMTAAHQEAFEAQVGFGDSLYNNVRKAIEQAAKNAADWLYKNELQGQGQVLLWALGGSDPSGDIAVEVNGRKITFELKYYKDLDSITWFTLSDADGNFPILFSEAMFNARNRIEGVWDTPQKPGLKKETWIENLQTIGLEHYVEHHLRKAAKGSAGFHRNAQLLYYLMEKAGAKQKYGGSSLEHKKVIVGSSALGKDRFHVTVSISELLKKQDKRTLDASQEGKTFVFRARNESLAGLHVVAEKLNQNASLTNEAGNNKPTWSTSFRMYVTQKLLGLPQK